MDLICYLHPSWEPLIRPAEATRPWMDATNESFAYRCLPLNIANAHGWEVLCPCDFKAYWRGGSDKSEVVIRTGAGIKVSDLPVSIFGHGVLTFHIFGIFRTPPGWNLFVTGSPNESREGIAPLSGVIETDWSPYTFTMNWRFLRRNHWVSFRRGEPICFLFPVQRHVLEQFTPRYQPMTDDLRQQFEAWSKSRDAFRLEMENNPPVAPSDKWQKRYYRGIDMHDRQTPDHKSRLRLAPFAAPNAPPPKKSPTLQLSGDTETLGRVLRLVAKGLADGTDPGTLAAGLQELGLTEADARAVIAASLQG
jgi:hypothetical protein